MNADVEVRRMKLSDLKPADYNPRKIEDGAFKGLGASLSRFGILSHIVWNKRTGNIVGGHQRYKHLLDEGEVETDVVVVDLDDDNEVALNITLNNRGIRGDFSRDVEEQLRMTEVRLGSAFRQIGLLDLYNYLQEHGFAGEEKEKAKRKKSPSSPGGGMEPSGGGSGGGGDKPQAVISCPKCQSQWRLTDNEVIFNGVLNHGTKMAGAKQ